MIMIIEDGIKRHTMSQNKLAKLYKQIAEFEADLTREEHERIKDAFTTIKTEIHLRQML